MTAEKTKPTKAQLRAAAVFELDAKAAPDPSFEGTWAVLCPITDGTCGNRAAGGDQSFFSPGWPSKTVATARFDEHLHEHKHPEEPASSLEDFRAKHGLTPTADGKRAVVITAKDL